MGSLLNPPDLPFTAAEEDVESSLPPPVANPSSSSSELPLATFQRLEFSYPDYFLRFSVIGILDVKFVALRRSFHLHQRCLFQFKRFSTRSERVITEVAYVVRKKKIFFAEMVRFFVHISRYSACNLSRESKSFVAQIFSAF